MLEAEQQSDDVINKLVKEGAGYSDPVKVKQEMWPPEPVSAQVMAALEADRAAMETQMQIVQEDVERLKAGEVLRAMQVRRSRNIRKLPPSPGCVGGRDPAEGYGQAVRGEAGGGESVPPEQVVLLPPSLFLHSSVTLPSPHSSLTPPTPSTHLPPHSSPESDFPV